MPPRRFRLGAKEAQIHIVAHFGTNRRGESGCRTSRIHGTYCPYRQSQRILKIMSATSTVTYNSTHTVTYVTDKMLLLLKEIIREIGLDPAKLIDEWEWLERGISTWLR